MSRYAQNPAPRSTCPWGDDSDKPDAHTLASEKASRRREAKEPQSTVPWKEPSPKPGQSAPPAPAEMQSEKMQFIQQCFDKGMTDDQVYEALDQFEAPLRQMAGLEPKQEERVTMADKRAHAAKLSDASLQKYDAEQSRSAYMESQNKAAQAREKNRAGSGIF
mmetsp:Transcript_8152/g.19458  ORF Transcript_8152/g.19458 Transcript_8152/m.19458 type:complete len:163 (-) Transcript_8152:262-750(-)